MVFHIFILAGQWDRELDRRFCRQPRTGSEVRAQSRLAPKIAAIKAEKAAARRLAEDAVFAKALSGN